MSTKKRASSIPWITFLHLTSSAGEFTNPPKITRETPPEQRDPSERFKDAKRTAEEWGTGEKGFLPPKAPADRMRKNVPYKVCPLNQLYHSYPLLMTRNVCSINSVGAGEISEYITYHSAPCYISFPFGPLVGPLAL
jgi:hypothetical protein